MNRNAWLGMCGLLVVLGAGCGKTPTPPTTPNLPPEQVVREVPPPKEVVDRTKDGYVHLRGQLLPGQESRVELLRLNDQISGSVSQAGATTRLVWGSADGLDMAFSAAQGEQVLFSVSGTWSGAGDTFTGKVSYLQAAPVPITLLVSEPDVSDGQAVLEVVSAKRKVSLSLPEGTPPTCESTIAYPQIASAAGVSPEAVTFINRRLREVAVSSTSPQAAVDAFVDDCREGQQDMIDNDAASAATEWSYDLAFSVALNRKHLLSVVFDSYQYTGGAHPNSIQEAISFDTQTGRELKITDLVDPEHLREFVKKEHALVLDSRSEDLFEESRDAFEAYVADTKPTSTEATVNLFGDWQDFYLDESTFTSFYNPYDITPYVGGLVEIDLPYVGWKNLMKADSPLKRLLER